MEMTTATTSTITGNNIYTTTAIPSNNTYTTSTSTWINIPTEMIKV